ncbi:MAG: hypothetical protein PHE15_02890 [Dehalococcoidales bacterium]|nr:hypothetical protein [Dehalococcoidales bacterium]
MVKITLHIRFDTQTTSALIKVSAKRLTQILLPVSNNNQVNTILFDALFYSKKRTTSSPVAQVLTIRST